MVAPSFLAAEAVTKYGKENIKVYLDDGRSTYYAITTRKEYSHIKLITVLPEEKVRLVCVRYVCEGVCVCVCVCVGGGERWKESRQNDVDMMKKSWML